MIEPRFKIGDTVWVIHGNNTFSERIASIQQYYTKDGIDLYYIFDGLGTVPANLVYGNKVELIKEQICFWINELSLLVDVNS